VQRNTQNLPKTLANPAIIEACRFPNAPPFIRHRLGGIPANICNVTYLRRNAGSAKSLPRYAEWLIISYSTHAQFI